MDRRQKLVFVLEWPPLSTPSSHLEQRGSVQQCSIATQANDKVDLVREIILAVAKCFHLESQWFEKWIVLQVHIVQYACLHEYCHVFVLFAKRFTSIRSSPKQEQSPYPNEKLHQIEEGLYDKCIVNLLDDQHCARWLVPC